VALAESVLAQREREWQAAELERSLLRAELSNLRLQLQPHFLFNALNTISSTMYEDVETADAQLTQLAELLRTSLRTSHAHEVPVRDELHLLAQYVALMQARFGEALVVEIDATDDVHDLLVPSMVLQPLVENAVRHGGVARVGHGRVSVRMRRVVTGATGDLEIRVHDDGPPNAMSTRSAASDGDSGTGLSATERRLRLLYGGAQTMQAGAAAEGGFAVTLRIPLRTHVPAEVVA
jgi:LytS/YehU family sensor histidine kinase